MSEENESKVEDRNEVKWRDRKHWLWFPWTFTKYEVRNGRLYIQQGFFKTDYDETLLYRIVDIKLTRTFFQKIFGTGTVALYTRVDSNKHILLENVKNPVEVKEYLSDMIESIRNEKKVVGKEFNGMMGIGHGSGDDFPDFDDNDYDEDDGDGDDN